MSEKAKQENPSLAAIMTLAIQVLDEINQRPCDECGETGDTLPCLGCNKLICSDCAGDGMMICKRCNEENPNELETR